MQSMTTPTDVKKGSPIRTGLAGVAIGAAALVGGLVALPALAGAQDDLAPETTETAPVERPDILGDLVDEGVITQEQADTIRERFEEFRAEHGGRFGHGHWRHHPFRGAASEVVTDLLGLTADEIREGFQDGQSLADMAEAEGVGTDALVDALVTEAQANVAEKLAAGDITQERADAILEDLEARIEARVTADRPLGGHGHGRFGPPAADDTDASLGSA